MDQRLTTSLQDDEGRPAWATWPSVQTPALAAAMCDVGPVPEWAWCDFLSPGDVLRVLRLREIVTAADTVADVHVAAMAALTEIRRAARERMNPPSDKEGC